VAEQVRSRLAEVSGGRAVLIGPDREPEVSGPRYAVFDDGRI
jgi:hypothetical protein